MVKKGAEEGTSVDREKPGATPDVNAVVGRDTESVVAVGWHTVCDCVCAVPKVIHLSFHNEICSIRSDRREWRKRPRIRCGNESMPLKRSVIWTKKIAPP